MNAEAEPRRPPLSWPLGDPAGGFRVAALLLEPVAWTRFLSLPLILIGFLTLLKNQPELLIHSAAVQREFSFWQGFLVVLLAANLAGKLSQGLAMTRLGSPPREIGMTIGFFLLPRFYIDTAPIPDMGYAEQRICYAAALRSRLMLFALGIVLWRMWLPYGSSLSDLFLATALGCLGSFLLLANPLFPADGQRWLGARLERPRYARQAYMLLWQFVRLKPLPAGLPKAELLGLFIFALASVAFLATFVVIALSTLAARLSVDLGSSGPALIVIVLVVLTILSVKRSARSRRKRDRSAIKPE